MRGTDLTSACGVGTIDYPSSDGEPMAETGIHVLLMMSLIAMLRDHFQRRDDVYVIGNIFLYYEEGNPAARRSPDVMVIFGVPSSPERDSFMTWKENAVPRVVFELTSDKTREEDVGPKRELYQQLGVEEYFLFDPLGDWLHRPLVGYRLIRREEPVEGNGHVIAEYEELPPAKDGSLISRELGLKLTPEGTTLALFEYATGRRLLSEVEKSAQVRQLNADLTQVQKAAREAQRQADQARQQADQASRERDDARRRTEELEQELARLRALLQRPEEDPPRA